MELCNYITQEWINAYISHPTAALLIHSPDDSISGLTIAMHIAKSLSAKNAPIYTVESTGKKSLGIDEVRELHKYLSLKANNDREYSRFVVVPEAEKLTPEAQNSLLKLLEELPEKTVVALVTAKDDAILPTIYSRCFKINNLPISRDQAVNYGVKQGYEINDVLKAYMISEGHTSSFMHILKVGLSEVEINISIAKEFIQSSVYERQKILQKIQKEEIDSKSMMQAFLLTARTGMRNAKSLSSKQQWKSILVKVMIAQKQLESNVQSKLVLLGLSVSL